MRIAAYSPTSGNLEKCGGGGGTSTALYDELQGIPIINVKGTIISPLIISDLEDGIYKVTGNYYLTSDTSGTQFIESSNCLFFVSKENKKFLKISPTNITEFSVKEDGTCESNAIVNGNITETIKQEVKNYFDNEGVTQDIVGIVDQRISERFGEATDEDIADLFS